MYFRQRNLKLRHVACMSVLLCSLNISADEQATNTVEPGKIVSFTYTLSLPDGEVLESNVDGQPLRYRQGEGTLLPALETALAGLIVGDDKSVTLAPKDAYGPVDDASFQEVPIEQIPEDARQVGATFNPPGHRGSIRVTEVGEEAIILDFNHPLAGKTLTFDITIISVE